MKVTLDQPVNIHGRITTLAAELDAGRAVVAEQTYFRTRLERDVTSWWVFIVVDGKLTDDGYSIGKKAYESRLAKGQDEKTFIARQDAPQPEPATVYDAELVDDTIRLTLHWIHDNGKHQDIVTTLPVTFERVLDLTWHEIDVSNLDCASHIPAALEKLGLTIHNTDEGAIAFSYPPVHISAEQKTAILETVRESLGVQLNTGSLFNWFKHIAESED